MGSREVLRLYEQYYKIQYKLKTRGSFLLLSVFSGDTKITQFEITSFTGMHESLLEVIISYIAQFIYSYDLLTIKN